MKRVETKTKLVAVTVDKEVYDRLEEDRWRMKLNRSQYVTQALREFLGKHDAQAQAPSAV